MGRLPAALDIIGQRDFDGAAAHHDDDLGEPLEAGEQRHGTTDAARGGRGGADVSAEENRAFVRRYYETILNGHDTAAIDDFLAPNFVSRGPSGPGFDRAAHVQALTVSFTALPDLHLTIDDQVAEGDKVVTRWSARGTHRGTFFFNIAPTGKEITATAIHIHRLDGGRIVEQWEQFDVLGVLQQLDALPAMNS
jgi:predicted ester cyclase